MWHKTCSAVLIGLFSVSPALAQGTKVSFPTGEGKPLAITCRAPQKLPDSRLLGPEICKTNAEWAQYRNDGMDISADGKRDVPGEKWRTLNTTGCRTNPAGGGGTTAFGYANLSPVCF